jgi:hypothetical protein
MVLPVLNHLLSSTNRLHALREELAELFEEPERGEDSPAAEPAAGPHPPIALPRIYSEYVLGNIPTAHGAAQSRSDPAAEEAPALPSGFSSGLGFLQPLQPEEGANELLEQMRQECAKKGTAFSDEVLLRIVRRLAVPTADGGGARRLHVPSRLSSRMSSRRSSCMSSASSTPREVPPDNLSNEELADAVNVSLFADMLLKKIASTIRQSRRARQDTSRLPSATSSPAMTPVLQSAAPVRAPSPIETTDAPSSPGDDGPGGAAAEPPAALPESAAVLRERAQREAAEWLARRSALTVERANEAAAEWLALRDGRAAVTRKERGAGPRPAAAVDAAARAMRALLATEAREGAPHSSREAADRAIAAAMRRMGGRRPEGAPGAPGEAAAGAAAGAAAAAWERSVARRDMETQTAEERAGDGGGDDGVAGDAAADAAAAGTDGAAAAAPAEPALVEPAPAAPAAAAPLASWRAWVPGDADTREAVRPASIARASSAFVDQLVERQMALAPAWRVADAELDALVAALLGELDARDVGALPVGGAVGEEEALEAILLDQADLDALIARCAPRKGSEGHLVLRRG